MEPELERVTNFIKELDRELNFPKPIPLYLIGGGAITLAYDHLNRTSDLDFIDPPEILAAKGGQGSVLAKKYDIYVSAVYEINFSVPDDWRQQAQKVNLLLKNLEVFVASIEDIVLGKLARMEPKDLEDILGLHEKELLDPKKLIERLNENKQELEAVEYRNNIKFLFSEVFDLKISFAQGELKITAS